MKRLLVLVGAVLCLCSCAEMKAGAPTEKALNPRFRRASAWENFGSGYGSAEFSVVTTLCDTANDNLIYIFAGAEGRGAMAVVVGGCKAEASR